MFHPTLPPLRWSSVEAMRANTNGWCWITELVYIKPMSVVSRASAESNMLQSAMGTFIACSKITSREPLNSP